MNPILDNRNGTAILNNPKVIAFYTTLVRNLATQGQLEWHAVRVESRLVAAVATLVGATLADLLAARLDPRIHRAS